MLPNTSTKCLESNLNICRSKEDHIDFNLETVGMMRKLKTKTNQKPFWTIAKNLDTLEYPVCVDRDFTCHHTIVEIIDEIGDSGP